MSNTHFDGDFSLLPLRSQIDDCAVPFAPTPDDFHVAVSALRAAEGAPDAEHGAITWRVAAARWRVEAVRERRATPGADVASPVVMARTAEALFRWSQTEG